MWLWMSKYLKNVLLQGFGKTVQTVMPHMTWHDKIWFQCYHSYIIKMVTADTRVQLTVTKTRQCVVLLGIWPPIAGHRLKNYYSVKYVNLPLISLISTFTDSKLFLQWLETIGENECNTKICWFKKFPEMKDVLGAIISTIQQNLCL